MKARVPIQKKLPRKTLQEVEGYAKEVVDRYEQDCMRRFFKLACLALNQGFGFGTDRLQKFIVAAGEHAGNARRNLVVASGSAFDRQAGAAF